MFLIPEGFMGSTIRCTDCHRVMPVTTPDNDELTSLENVAGEVREFLSVAVDENVFRAPRAATQRPTRAMPAGVMLALIGISMLGVQTLWSMAWVIWASRGTTPEFLIIIARLCVEFLVFRGLLRRSQTARILAILMAGAMSMLLLAVVGILDDPSLPIDPESIPEARLWLAGMLATEVTIIIGLLTRGAWRYFSRSSG